MTNKALVMDSDPGIARLFKSMLDGQIPEFTRVMIATSFSEAIMLLQNPQEFDLVLLNYEESNEFNIIGIVRFVKNLHPECKIFLTFDPVLCHREKVSKVSGVDGCFPKGMGVQILPMVEIIRGTLGLVEKPSLVETTA